MGTMPEKFEVVAVAEPIDNRREYVREKHNIPEDRCFTHWKDLLALGKIADAAVITTMDRDHTAPALIAADLGYDMLLEKPIASTPEDCVAVRDRAVANNVKVVLGTVLRYTDIFNCLKNLIDSGRLGEVMSINHEECVGNVHQTHSFVRGKWGNEGRSSFMLLQKSCHDFDILQWLLGKKCRKVQSFGTLSYFTKENAPEGAPDYCVQGCPAAEECPYHVDKVYMTCEPVSWFGKDITRQVIPTKEMMAEAVTHDPYGRCVFKCDNDVVDHQTVNMLFDGGVTVTFSMNAFNKGGRHIHIMGTKGEVHAAMDGESPVKLFDFKTRETETVPLTAADGMNGGHGGGDGGIIVDFYDYLAGIYTGKSVPTIEESCYNHLITFAAEEARLTGTIVDVDEYIKKVQG
ncbi:MAG: Gfo/Idh/MocA family oxidoreductase [Abditibacteriota bacterium]|nr:Gfo/Idh/MocA family oxidoreductase [Abditibacteriota bacterium]